MPGLKAYNFVLNGTRMGGVGSALDTDAHGKSLSWALRRWKSITRPKVENNVRGNERMKLLMSHAAAEPCT